MSYKPHVFFLITPACSGIVECNLNVIPYMKAIEEYFPVAVVFMLLYKLILG